MDRNIIIQIGERDFPVDLVENILSRLPVESLLKSRCVSKSWRSLIDSQEFIKIHLKKSTENESLSHHRILLNPRDRLFETCTWTQIQVFSLLEEPFEFDDLKHIDRDREVNIVGCCNGLVCLFQEGGKFMLWNPSTRMSLDLPDAHSVDGDFPMYGFGYDESSNDYKVFAVVISQTHKIQSPVAVIYSLKSHSWKTLEVSDFPYCGDEDGKFVSGNLHWFGEENWEIVSFDLAKEAFGEVEQPNATYLATQTLGVMDGCLSVLCDYRHSQFGVWVMKEYGEKESWVILYTIPNVNHPPLAAQEVRSFYRGPNREILMIYDTNLVIYCYDAEEDMFGCSRIIEIDEVMGDGVYVQSLVSLGPNAVINKGC